MKLLLSLFSFHSAIGFLAVPNLGIQYSSTCLSFASLQGSRSQAPKTQTRSSSSCAQGSADGNAISRGYKKYVDLSERRPYPTKAVSAGIVVGAGAILSQWIQAVSAGVPLVLDWHLVRSFALTGLLFEGPYCKSRPHATA